MALFGHLFAFVRVPLPAGSEGSYRTAGILLKILCWLTLIFGAGYALLTTVIAFVLMVGGALFGTVMDDFSRALGAPEFGDVARGFGVLFGFLMLLLALVILVVATVLLYLGSRVAQGWALRDPAWGITGSRVLTGILGGLTLFGVLSVFAATPGEPRGSLSQLVFGALCVAIFVLSYSQGVKREFAKGRLAEGGMAAPPPPATLAPPTPQYLPTAATRPSAGHRWTCPRCRRLYTVLALPPAGSICQSCAAS